MLAGGCSCRHPENQLPVPKNAQNGHGTPRKPVHVPKYAKNWHGTPPEKRQFPEKMRANVKRAAWRAEIEFF